MVKQQFKTGWPINQQVQICLQLLAMFLNVHVKFLVAIVSTRPHIDLFAHTTTVTIKHHPRAIQRVVLNHAINTIPRRDEFPQLCWDIASPFGCQGRKSSIFDSSWNS